MSGGEPDGRRLLDLARAELLAALLPELDGEARYRARLIANAMKIAANELAAAPPREAAADRLRGFTERALGSAAAGPADDGLTALRDALRSGALDGDAALHELLVQLTAGRRDLLG